MYKLRFPFETNSWHEIGLDELTLFECNGLEVSLDREGRYYVLGITGFKTEDEAKNYIANIRAGLMWLLLKRGLAVNATFEAQPVKIAENPAEFAKKIKCVIGRMGGWGGSSWDYRWGSSCSVAHRKKI